MKKEEVKDCGHDSAATLVSTGDRFYATCKQCLNLPAFRNMEEDYETPSTQDPFGLSGIIPVRVANRKAFAIIAALCASSSRTSTGNNVYNDHVFVLTMKVHVTKMYV